LTPGVAPRFLSPVSAAPADFSQFLADLDEYLEGFAPAARSRGQGYLHRVRALNFRAEAERATATATVFGTLAYQCSLQHERVAGWAATCSCPVQGDCKHLYAMGVTLRDLLAVKTDVFFAVGGAG
jgi:uncharacterized Zn finger protein